MHRNFKEWIDFCHAILISCALLAVEILQRCPCLLLVLAASLPGNATWLWNHSEDHTTVSKLVKLNGHNNASKMMLPGDGEN
jgi:hypothetical protein